MNALDTKKILITSALPYANGPLHFGHIAGAYLPADCYARFQRLAGHDVLYICGSDEFGMAITLSAELAGRTPKEHVDIFHAVNKGLFDQLNVSFDHYSRTTWLGHIPFVHQFFLDLYHNGHIQEKVTEQLFSEADNKFLADRYVVGTCPKCKYENARGDECGRCGTAYDAIDLINPRSKITGSALVKKPTKHWFLQLEHFKEQLLEWLSTKEWKPNVVNFIKGFIEDLHARAITRDTTWGIPIPLPDTEGKVLYVWFDAPIGYISATKEWAEKQGKPDAWRDYWLDPKTKLVQFIGKDNIPFHAAIFPAMTMGQSQPYKLVDELPANEFYNLEGKQFSKSDGWYIDLDDFFKRYTADQIRYAIASNAPETSDSEFTWKDFQSKCNSDLVGKFGNLINRVLVFSHQNMDGKVPPAHVLNEVDLKFKHDLKELTDEIYKAYDTFKLRRATQILMEIAQRGNVYFNEKQPWKAIKQDNKDDVETTLNLCMECLKILALASAPVIPYASKQIWKMLGFDQPINAQTWDTTVATPLPVGQALQPPVILFQKIEDSQIEQEVAKLKSTNANNAKREASSPTNLVTIDQVRNVELKVAKILHAEKVEKSQKLLKLKLDDGNSQRTIVSGIAQYYQPDEILGKNVVIVSNLQPAKLMGIESQGMLLAAKWGDQLRIVTLDDAAPGAVVS